MLYKSTNEPFIYTNSSFYYSPFMFLQWIHRNQDVSIVYSVFYWTDLYGYKLLVFYAVINLKIVNFYKPWSNMKILMLFHDFADLDESTQYWFYFSIGYFFYTLRKYAYHAFLYNVFFYVWYFASEIVW
jgi:hypothetical protein